MNYRNEFIKHRRITPTGSVTSKPINQRNGHKNAKKSESRLRPKNKVTFILIDKITKHVTSLAEKLELPETNIINSEQMRNIIREQVKRRYAFEKKDMSSLIKIDSPYIKNSIDRYFKDGTVYIVKK